MADKNALINDFANRSFRDSADQDYILARIAYRREFDQQFRWCALQALEKYFKAILIYNRISTKKLGHNIEKALRRLEAIEDLEFSLPSQNTRDFITYLAEYGPDRYLSHPTHLKEGALLILDETVWAVRRYCYFMRETIVQDGEKKELFERNKKITTDPFYEKYRHKFRIRGGYLEKVLDKGLPAYRDLVWKNFYYGRVKKHRIRKFRIRMSFQNPTHTMYPDVFDELEHLVDFPKTVPEKYKR